jgi:acetamidase/formamidase
MLAPVISFTAHEAWRYLPARLEGTVFEAGPTHTAQGDAAVLLRMAPSS